MRVLVGKAFGIGNACLAVPMVKAIASLGHRVDVLVGSGPDDFGARDVFEALRTHGEYVGSIWTDSVPFGVDAYDVAIMSIPYDGRWKNGLDFFARTVMDGRARPDNVQRLGFDMWKKHEVEYQMDNANELGFSGAPPDGSFMERAGAPDHELIYLGIGFKRDPGGFGLSKHFGNERYAALIREIRRLRPTARFVSTGSTRDTMEVGYRIVAEMSRGGMADAASVYRCGFGTDGAMRHAFDVISGCGAYLGNDTGMMHVAASMGLPTFGLFAYRDLLVKNPPFCERSRAVYFDHEQPSVEALAQQFVDFVWG